MQILIKTIPSAKIWEAPTGKMALKMLKNCSIDMIFLDIELPDLSGLEIAEEIIEVARKLARGIQERGGKREEKSNEIKFSLRECTLKISKEDIVFVESQKRNCLIHTKNKQYENQQLYDETDAPDPIR